MRVWALGPALWLATVSTVFGAEIERRYAPTIGEGGVVNAASFRPAPENLVVPNGIISIFGIDLALRTKTVGMGDLQQGRLPLSLGGVTVDVGGIPAPLYFVSPGQINVQAPSTLPPNQVTVRVFRESLLSNEVTVKVAKLDPGLFMFVGRPIITHLDYKLVGRGEFEGSTPEYVVLFATGMGLTLPPVLAGQLPMFAAQTLAPVRVWVGERLLEGAASIQYSGQAPGLAGVYQINLLLPLDVPLGDPEIIVDTRTQPGLTIAIDPTPEPAPDPPKTYPDVGTRHALPATPANATPRSK
jgi:uncharacterized protein (TIGR03437 family)